MAYDLEEQEKIASLKAWWERPYELQSLDMRTYELVNVRNGKEMEMQTDLSDYKDVEGVKMPFSITQQFGTVLISTIKVNQAIPESLFKHDM